MNEDCLDIWVVDMIYFMALGLRRMSFRHGFSATRAEKDELPIH
jgi:hypothetical protein